MYSRRAPKRNFWTISKWNCWKILARNFWRMPSVNFWWILSKNYWRSNRRNSCRVPRRNSQRIFVINYWRVYESNTRRITFSLGNPGKIPKTILEGIQQKLLKESKNKVTEETLWRILEENPNESPGKLWGIPKRTFGGTPDRATGGENLEEISRNLQKIQINFKWNF